MAYKECKTCGAYGNMEYHKCPPIHLVYHPDYMGDEPEEVRASSHENAARLYAQRYNTMNDYCLMNETINVKVEKDGKVEYWRVGAEPDIHYTSNEATEEEYNEGDL